MKKETSDRSEGQKQVPRKRAKKFFQDETFLKKETSNRSERTKAFRKGGDEAMNEKEVRERFEKIYNSTYDYIYKFLIIKSDSRETAEDILQSVYLAFYKRMLSGERVLDPKHYLLRMAKHGLADYYSHRKETDSIDVGIEIVDEKALDMLENDDSYTYKEIMGCLKDMDETTYKIFQLHFGHDCTLEKTANSLGLAESTVKSKMYRALKKLKKEIKEGERYAFFRRSEKI